MSPHSPSSVAHSPAGSAAPQARHVIPTPAGGKTMDAFKTPTPSASSTPTAPRPAPAPQSWKPGQSGSAGASNPLLGGHRARPTGSPQASAASTPVSPPSVPVPLLDAAPPQHWHHRGTLGCQMKVLAAHRFPPAPATATSAGTSAPTPAGLPG